MLRHAVEVIVMRVAEVDSWECENRDGKREDSIKEEVNRWREG
jgi:hypothetical protein